MVAAQERHARRLRELQRDQQQHHLDREEPAVHVVAQEEHARYGRGRGRGAGGEQREAREERVQVVVLPVQVAHDGHGRDQVDHVGLAREQRRGARQQRQDVRGAEPTLAEQEVAQLEEKT